MKEGFQFSFRVASCAFASLALALCFAPPLSAAPTEPSPYHSQENLHCGDFQKIIEFVHAEHLRFRVSPPDELVRLLQEGIEKLSDEMRTQGYHFLAAHYDQEIRASLKATSWRSVRELCELLPSSSHREFFLKAFVGALDPFSQFYTLDEMPRRTSVVDGHFVGVGIATVSEDHFIRVTEVVQDGPSFGQLEVGDLISHVDGRSVRGLSAEQLRNRIRGELGTKVVFRGRREDKVFETSVLRGHVYQTSVSYQKLEADILQIKIHRFYAQTASQIESILKRYPEAKALILDLRDNPGGLLQAARDVVNLFVPTSQGVVVHLRGIYEDQILTSHVGQYTERPLVVLINERSASASEIVAGALQDYGRAVLVGRQTYGKSCVQNIYETHTAVGTEYRGGLKLTTLWYYLPSGRSSDTIRPDVLVAQTGEASDLKPVSMPYQWPQKIDVRDPLLDSHFRVWLKPDTEMIPSTTEFEEAGRMIIQSLLTQSAQSEP